MATPYDSFIQQSAAQQGIDPRLLTAVIGTESSFNPNAVNPETQASGLGQQIPDTANRLGIDPRNPAQSIDGAARQLAENIRRYGSVDDAVRAYHGGTDKANWGPKTEEYVRKVSAAFRNQPEASAQPPASPLANDPDFAGIAAKASGQTSPQAATPSGAQFDSDFAGIAAKASGQMSPAPQPAPVPRGTQMPGDQSDQYRSTLSPDRQKAYDKTLSDLRAQANFIQTGPNPGLGDKIMGGSWRGINDASDFLTGGLGFAGNRLGLVSDQAMDDYMHATQRIRDEYEQARQAAVPQTVGGLVSGKKPDAGIDWGRAIGQTAAGGAAGRVLEAAGGAIAPVLGESGSTGILGADLASSRLGRMVQNAFTGGTAAAVASPQSSTPVGEQTAIGAATGAILPPVVSKLAGAVAKPFASLLTRGGQQAAQEASQGASQTIQDNASSIMGAVTNDAQGNVSIDASKLSPGVQDMLKGPLKGLTPEQQARVLTYESLDIPYSLADVTRNAADAMTERNLAQNVNAGAPLRDLDQAKNEALINAANRATQMTGAQPMDNLSMGQAIREHLQAQAKVMDGQINQAYQAADAAAGNAPRVSTSPIANTLSSLRSQFLSSSDGLGLLNGIRGRLQEFGGGVPKNPGKPLLLDASGNPLLTEGDIPRGMTFQDSERFRQFLNDVSTPDNYRLVKQIKNAVDQAQDNAGQGNIYEAARNLRQQRSAMFENQGGIQKILANTPGGDPRFDVGKIMDQYVFNKGNVDQLNQLINQLNKGGQDGQQLVNQLRATAMQRATEGALSKVPGEKGVGMFSGQSFANQLDKMGASKIQALFTQEQQNYLGALRRGSVDLTTSPPVRNAYNPSGTAAQGINMLEHLAGGAPSQAGKLAQATTASAPVIGASIGSALPIPGGAAAGAWLGGIIKSRAEKAAESKAEDFLSRQAQAAANPLEAMTKANAPKVTPQMAEQERIRRALAARLMGNPAALGGALQPSN